MLSACLTRFSNPVTELTSKDLPFGHSPCCHMSLPCLPTSIFLLLLFSLQKCHPPPKLWKGNPPSKSSHSGEGFLHSPTPPPSPSAHCAILGEQLRVPIYRKEAPALSRGLP